MNHIRIELDKNTFEEVSESLINLLYDEVLKIPDSNLNEDAYLSGHLSVPYSYRSYVEYLAGTIGEGTSGIITTLRLNAEGRFEDLRIDVTNGYYIPFEDSKTIEYLASLNLGNNGKLTEPEAAAVTTIATTANTNVVKFNELKYFTSIDGSIGNTCNFKNWTALKEIDISNFTCVGHKTYNEQNGFKGCTSLEKVTVSNKLTLIGKSAFYGCTSLENIIGLSGIITLSNDAFRNCTNLNSNSFLNCTFYFSEGDIGSSAFNGCASLTNISISGYISSYAFRGCSNLDTVNFSNIYQVGGECFKLTKLSGEINFPNYVNVPLGYSAFNGTKITRVLSLGNCTSIGFSCFSSCSELTDVTLPSSCTKIEQDAFQSCTKLTSINVENVTELGTGNFGWCTALKLLYFKELLTYSSNKINNNGLFSGGQYIYAPKLPDVVGGFDTGGNNVRGLFVQAGWGNSRNNKKIVYFKNLSSVQTGAFCGGNVKHLVINNTTPPTVTAFQDKKQDLLIDVSGGGVSSSVVQNVWVPDSAVNDYKNHTYWGEFGNKIRGLSGLNKVATRSLWDLLTSSELEDTLIEEYM